MSGTVNKVILIGHLGEPVKAHYFENGGCVARFTLATNDFYIDKQSQQKITTTDWHHLVVKNKLAEICDQHLKKGDKIYCEGKLKTRNYELDGQKKQVSEIHVFEINFLGSSKTNHREKPNQHLQSGESIINDLPF